MLKIITFFLLSTLALFLYPKTNTEVYFNIAEKKLSEYNFDKRDYVVVIDYTKHIFQKRLFLLDMKNKKVVLNCRVSHAYKSGLLYAQNFSNEFNSEKSSYGAFITKNARPGKYGYSMVIDGLDIGINDNVKKRVVIFHPTTVTYSKGCFATSKDYNKIIIDHIKDGRLVYVMN